MPRKNKKTRKKILRLIGAAAVWGFAGGMLVLAYFCYGLPGLDDVKPLDVQPGISILAADGSLLARYGGMKGDIVRLDDLPPYVPHAVMAVEDRRFYKHPGVDILGLGRAMLANVKAGGFVQGGSTLTQQLAKNLFLTADKTLRRKGQEAIMALMIERRYTKDEILEAYLNRVYFGAGAYGIDAAARAYFSKNARDLTLWESAVLAGLLKAPARYSPSSSPQRARERAITVIHAMEDAGYITPDMAKAEIRNGFIHAPGAQGGAQIRYFTDWIVNQIDSYVTAAGGGIVVRTTLNPDLQVMAEKTSTAMLNSLSPEDKISQCAMVTLAKNGAVLAMIGGRDYGASQFNRATLAMRQPGSAFKPFVYLAALEAGFSPSDTILDAPFTSGKYRPENYDGQYYGEVTLTDALAHSLNAATIRLLSDVGVAKLLDVATRAGFTTHFKAELATGLGAGEVSLIELANAYAVLGNGGRAVWPYAVTEIRDSAGTLLYSREDTGAAQIFSSRDISQLDDMLVQVVARGTGQAAQLSRGHVAGKTGTSQNYRDAWFVGYTDSLVTGVWMGNDDNSPMNKVSGGKYPARLWHDYMNDAIGVRNVPGYGGGFFQPVSDSFSNMLRRWSSDEAPESKPPRFTPDNRPVYNN